VNEVWKTVVGFPDYQVSNLGRVKSLSRYFFNGRGMVHTKDKILKAGLDPKGYYRVSLSKDGQSYTCKVHRLVADAFVENPCNKSSVNHLDENTKNNQVANLEWVSHRENMNYGTKGQRQAQKISRPIIQYSKTGVFISRYKSIKAAASENGFCVGNIWYSLSKNRKYAYGYIWNYESEVKKHVNTSQK